MLLDSQAFRGAWGRMGNRACSSQTSVPGLAGEKGAWRFKSSLSIIHFCGWIYAIRIYLRPHYLLLHRNPAPSQVWRQRLEFGARRCKADLPSKKSLGAEGESWMMDGTCRARRLSH